MVIDGLIEAIKDGTKNRWIRINFPSKFYANDLSNPAIIHDLLLRKTSSSIQNLYKCENCDGLLVQIGQTNDYRIYLSQPDYAAKITGGYVDFAFFNIADTIQR